MADSKSRVSHEPKTGFGRFMVHYFIPQYANNVMGLVYIGAAILIIIVGLRGLGSSVADNPLVPQFLIEDGRIGIQYVMIALYLEFVMLLILATVTFFTPEDSNFDKKKDAGSQVTHVAGVNVDVSQVEENLKKLKTVAEDEMRLIEGYLEKFDSIADKVNNINRKNLEALSDMKEMLKN